MTKFGDQNPTKLLQIIIPLYTDNIENNEHVLNLSVNKENVFVMRSPYLLSNFDFQTDHLRRGPEQILCPNTSLV